MTVDWGRLCDFKLVRPCPVCSRIRDCLRELKALTERASRDHPAIEVSIQMKQNLRCDMCCDRGFLITEDGQQAWALLHQLDDQPVVEAVSKPR